MKKKLLFVAAFVLLAWSFTSCSKTDCQFCKIVTRDPGGAEVFSNGGADYCGVELAAYKLANPEITDPVTKNVTKVECN